MTSTMRFLKILAGFALVAGTGAVAAPKVADLAARGILSDAGPAQGIAGDGAVAAGPRHSFGSGRGEGDPFRLTILSKVAYYVGEDYVDQRRVDPTKMLVAALDALQRNIAEVQVEELPDGRLKVHVSTAEKTFDGKVRDIDELVVRLKDVFAFLKKELPPQKEPQDLEYAAIGGLLSTLDPHSVLLPPEVYDEMKLSTSGEFGGLGIVIAIRDAALTVISPLDDTPASRAGIKAGDKITRIGEESTVNMNLEEAVKKLRGPKGTAVTIAIARKSLPEPREFTLIRDTIRIKNVEGQLLSGNVGYIRVKGFQEATGEDVRRQMADLRALAPGKKLEGVILDLRNNPGGLLDEAIRLSDLFLENGPIVTTVGVGNKLRDQKDARWPETDKDTPVIVLTNGGSASASEIVAGALKNRDRAVVLGEQTFGKGSVQNLFDLRDGSALKLTIAKYLTPGDVSIQSVGVTPDIETIPVKISAEHIDLTGESRKFREADLERHFDGDEPRESKDKPVYSLRFLEGEYTPPKGKFTTLEDKKKDGEKDDEAAPDEEEEEIDPEYRKTADLTKDFEVQLAMNLLQQAGSVSRKKMLAGAQAVVKKAAAEQDRRLVEEFRTLGIDWTSGRDAGKPRLGAVVDFGVPDGTATAGEELKVTVTVTNNGTSDVTRLRGLTESDEPLFDGLEFAFGRVKPGQSKSWTLPMKLPKSWPASVTEMKVDLQRMEESPISTVTSRLTVKPLDHPAFAYSWRIVDEPESDPSKGGGNGDGIAQAGEMVEMELTVTNLGPGQAPEPMAIVKNLEGEGVFIDRGRIKFDPLAPGKKGTGRFRFEVREGFEDSEVELRVTIADAVFGDYLSEKLALPTGEKGIPVAEASGRVQLMPNTEIRSGASTRAGVLARAMRGGVYEMKAKAGASGEWVQVALPDGRLGWVDVAKTAGAGRTKLSSDGLEYARNMAPKLEVRPERLIARSDKASVQGTAVADQGMKDLWILVNDKKVFYRTFPDAREPVSFISELPLEDGQNRVVIVARDQSDLQSMQSFSIRREPSDDAARLPKKSKSRAN